MVINTRKEDLFFVIEIDGDLDASSSIQLDTTLTNALSASEKKIMVDCGRLNYISSAGLGVFMSYLQDFETNQTQMILFNVSEKVKNVFKVLGLDNLIQIVADKKEAMRILHHVGKN
jgi:anti-sigma B factor antagonist